jgi:hypothetical protein
VAKVESGRTEFRPDPSAIRRAQTGQLWWVAWAAALSALSATLGVTQGNATWVVMAGIAAAMIGLGFVAVGVMRHRELGRVLRDNHGLLVRPEALVLPGEPPVPWQQVVAVVAHRLEWSGLEVTLKDGRRIRVLAQHFGAPVDEMAGAVAQHVPVGDPEAAYRNWGEYWNS